MSNHPIEGLMTTAMESIKEMVDVNTIVGDAVQAPDGTVIIPISRVCFGFAAGGGEYGAQTQGKEQRNTNFGRSNDENEEDTNAESTPKTKKFPFAGGSGAGVSIHPVAFMVVGNEQIKLLPVNVNSSLDKILDLIPELFDKANDAMKKRMIMKKEMKCCEAESESKEDK